MLNRKIGFALARVLASVCILVLATTAMADPSKTIEPDPAIQSKIRDLARAIKQAGQSNGGLKVYETIGPLKQVMKEGSVNLIQQLILHHAEANDVAEGMTLAMAVQLIEIPKTELISAIAPIIRETNDPKLEEAILEVTRIIEDCDTHRGCDFSHYQSYIEGRLRAQQELDENLIAHMFHRSPSQSLQVFTLTVYQDERRKPFLWAAHTVDDLLWKRQFGFTPARQPDEQVIQEIDKMSKRDEWWARLYAAEIIRQHPELGSQAIVDRLKADKNEVVLEAIEPEVER